MRTLEKRKQERIPSDIIIKIIKNNERSIFRGLTNWENLIKKAGDFFVYDAVYENKLTYSYQKKYVQKDLFGPDKVLRCLPASYSFPVGFTVTGVEFSVSLESRNSPFDIHFAFHIEPLIRNMLKSNAVNDILSIIAENKVCYRDIFTEKTSNLEIRHS